MYTIREAMDKLYAENELQKIDEQISERLSLLICGKCLRRIIRCFRYSIDKRAPLRKKQEVLADLEHHPENPFFQAYQRLVIHCPIMSNQGLGDILFLSELGFIHD